MKLTTIAKWFQFKSGHAWESSNVARQWVNFCAFGRLIRRFRKIIIFGLVYRSAGGALGPTLPELALKTLPFFIIK